MKQPHICGAQGDDVTAPGQKRIILNYTNGDSAFADRQALNRIPLLDRIDHFLASDDFAEDGVFAV